MRFLGFVIFCAARCLVVSSQLLDLLELEVVVYSSKSQLTQRAPDWWESARFQAFSRLEVGSGKMALIPPTSG